MENVTGNTALPGLNMDSQAYSNQQVSSQAISTSPTEPMVDTKAEREQVKGLLAEARKTRDVLVGFRAAIEAGTFHGSKMMDIAQGMAFLDAILRQNQAHIHNLQERTEK
jgi:hypothetical protein